VAAWRLKEAQHRSVYSFQDADRRRLLAAELTAKAVYGFAGSLNGDCVCVGSTSWLIRGCYATSVILALAPLLKGDLIDRGAWDHF